MEIPKCKNIKFALKNDCCIFDAEYCLGSGTMNAKRPNCKYKENGI